MESPTRRGLPGVLVLLLAAGALLLVPFALATRTSVQEFTERVRAADEIDARLDEVEAWLQLSSALAGEATATSGVLVERTLPPIALSFIDTDFGAALDSTRLAVDDVLSTGAVDAAAIEDDLRMARSAIDGGELPANEAIGSVLAISAAIRSEVQHTLRDLGDVVGIAHGADEVARAVAEAGAAVDLSVRVSDAASYWAVIINPADQPPAAAVSEFVGAVALRRDAVDGFASTIRPGSPIEPSWTAWSVGESRQIVDAVYAQTIVDLAALSVPAPANPPELELTPELVDEFLEAAAVAGAFEREVTDAYLLAQDAIGSAVEANEMLQSESESSRNRALIALIVLIGVVLTVAGGLGWLLVRPLRRLGATAAALRRGDLDTRATVAGPAELRSAATAMNDALDSLQRTEAKATALAEARLDAEVFAEDDTGPLSGSLDAAVARLADSMSERESLRERLAHDAAHDGLTLLPNRTAVLAHLGREIETATATGDVVALLYIDLDGFKAVNDAHGHHTGDQLLQSIARRLGTELVVGETAGRIGGDEIVIVCRGVDGEVAAVARAEELRRALSEPVSVDGTVLAPGLSIGVAISSGDGVSGEELMRRADLALYRAKDLGRGRVEFCDERVRRRADSRRALDSAVTSGLADGEFELHYQPVFDARSGQICSIEALLRWTRNGTSVSPAELIAHAERSELIVELDRWVFGEAIAQAARWTEHPELGGAPVSVNVSGRHVSSGTLADDVLAVLHALAVSPDRLMLELTETSVLTDVGRVAADLQRLSAAGVVIALDDYGTGYMSLGTLRELDVDVLKIDRSFVSHIDRENDRELLGLMVRTGHVLDVSVVVEGIETSEQRRIVHDLGADGLQGFLLAEPAPPWEIPAALACARELVARHPNH